MWQVVKIAGSDVNRSSGEVSTRLLPLLHQGRGISSMVGKRHQVPIRNGRFPHFLGRHRVGMGTSTSEPGTDNSTLGDLRGEGGTGVWCRRMDKSVFNFA